MTATGRARRLVAGVGLLFVMSYGSTAAIAPTVIAPITDWKPLPLPEARSGPDGPPLHATPTPQPTKAPRPSVRPVVKPKPVIVTRSLRGEATWYCAVGVSRCTRGYPDRPGIVDAYGAAGPRLRAALGSNWRGRTVFVDGVPVRLIDFCLCTGGPNRLIDAYFDVWKQVGGNVVITW